MLPRRPLGVTGIEVSVMGLGAVAFGRTRLTHYARQPVRPTAEQLERLLHVARELGVNLIDTSPAYGDSETRIGRLLWADRERWVICTKAGEQFDGRRSTWNFSRRALTESVEQSLRRLRTDYIDIVLLHAGPDDFAALREIDALRELRDQGKIRGFGISHRTCAAGVQAARVCGVIMTQLSSLHRDQLPAVRTAARLGCGVLVKKALDRGFANVEASLRYVVRQPGVSSVVVGTLRADHLAANAREIIDELDSASTTGITTTSPP